MKRFALTGGIASGKSLVAQFFRKAGVPVIDADQLSRKVVEKGTLGLQKITDTFGHDVLNAQGQLDRQKMGDLVFSDPQKRKVLERILHPLIAQAGASQMSLLETDGHLFSLYEASLIFENNLEEAFDATLLVTTTVEIQIARLRQRDDLSPQEAQKRVDAQMSVEEKKRRCSFHIENNSTKVQLQLETAKVWKKMTGTELNF
jgi:dephospho-CoA kinase